MNGRGRVALIVVALVAALGALLAIGISGSDRPLDLESHEPQGTSALVALLDELGADVTVSSGLPDGSLDDPDGPYRFDVTLVLRDRLDDAGRSELGGWVRSGGVLVVADPESELAPLTTEEDDDPEEEFQDLGQLENVDITGPSVTIPRDECTIDALDHRGLRFLESFGYPTRYRVQDDRESCFGDGTRAFVVATSRDEGVEVVLGGAGVWTNRALAHEDNAALAAFLLAPEPGTRVNVLDPTARTGPGEDSLWDVAPAGLRRAMVQLGLAFLAYAVWRARRLGKPVVEPQPVKVASSELVAAVGGLLKRTGSPQHAADTLRADLRRDLVQGLGLSADLPPDAFFRVVESRCASVGPEWLHKALGPGPVASDAELVDVARSIDIVRKEVLESVGT